MIEAIIFDWGGVLMDNPTNELMEYCAESLEVDASILRTIFSKYESTFQRGEISEDELWNKICEKLNIKKPSVESLWKDALKHTLNDKGQIYTLTQILRKEGYKLGFLSNTEIPAMDYFLEKEYDKYFDVTTFSCVEKTVKPEERIYTLTLERLRVRPEKSIFIDDNPAYIEGAKKVGMNGIVFETPEQLINELAYYAITIDVAKIQAVPLVSCFEDSTHNIP